MGGFKMIKILSSKGWESTEWHSLVEIITHKLMNDARIFSDSEYLYVIGVYDGLPEIYRMEK